MASYGDLKVNDLKKLLLYVRIGEEKRRFGGKWVERHWSNLIFVKSAFCQMYKDIKNLYTSLIENMETINQGILKVEKNMKNLVEQAGPIMEGQLSALLQSFPKPSVILPMDSNKRLFAIAILC